MPRRVSLYAKLTVVVFIIFVSQYTSSPYKFGAFAVFPVITLVLGLSFSY